jgi:hypothetical protein
VLKMSSSDKHEHKTLSAEVEIIKILDRGETLTNLAKEYAFGHATIYNIRKNRDFFPNFSSNPVVPWSRICQITKIVLYIECWHELEIHVCTIFCIFVCLMCTQYMKFVKNSISCNRRIVHRKFLAVFMICLHTTFQGH